MVTCNNEGERPIQTAASSIFGMNEIFGGMGGNVGGCDIEDTGDLQLAYYFRESFQLTIHYLYVATA